MILSWIPALAGAMVTGLVPLLVWYARKTDRAARLTNDNLAQMRESLALIDDLKRDFWDLEDWASIVRARWRTQQEHLCNSGAIDHIEELPRLPDSRVSRRRDDHLTTGLVRRQPTEEPPTWM